MVNLRFELEDRVFGLFSRFCFFFKMAVAFSSVRVESSRDTQKTGNFLIFFLEFFSDLCDHFWPSFEYKMWNIWFSRAFFRHLALYVSYSKLGQKWSKSTKIKKFWKLRKNPVFWHPDHFSSPRTRFSSSDWKFSIFQFFNFFRAQNHAFFQGE